MYANSVQNQYVQSESDLFFESNNTPFISLINLVFNKDNKIEMLDDIDSKSEMTLESKNVKFVNTNKSFVFNISKQDDEWLVHFQLSGSDSLTEEEKDICKYYMKELNSIGFCFYIDNEEDTFDFDSEIYGIYSEPKQIKTNSIHIKDEYWANITNKMKELSVPDNIKQRIRVQRTQLEKKYGKDNYKPYFDSYFKKQMEQLNAPEVENEKESIKLTSDNSHIWDEISNRMKELNMDAKTMNRIRVQRWHLINKYGDDYINYIGEYAEKQFNKYINKKN